MAEAAGIREEFERRTSRNGSLPARREVADARRVVRDLREKRVLVAFASLEDNFQPAGLPLRSGCPSRQQMVRVELVVPKRACLLLGSGPARYAFLVWVRKMRRADGLEVMRLLDCVAIVYV